MGWSVNHVLTRSVRDSAAVLDAVAVFDPGALWTLKQESGFFAGLDDSPELLRIAYSIDPPNSARLDDRCRDAVLSTVELLVELGHEVEEAAPDMSWDAFFRVYCVIVAGAWAALMAEVEARRPGSFALLEPANQVAAEYGQKLTAMEFVDAVRDMQIISRRLMELFRTHDAWLTPTLAGPPLPLGSFDAPSRGSFEEFLAFDAQWNPWLPLANCTGSTGASLPLHWSEAGQPIGVQFTMAPGEERRLLRLASVLEEARPWRDRWPPLSIPAVWN
jgi:amidase